MARFPIIDSPCPLAQSELAGIANHCSRCNKTVHSLDGMDDAGRAAFMSRAKGPICVSYRLPIAASAALALSLAAPALAQEVAPAPSPVRQVITAPAHPNSPAASPAVAATADVKAKTLDDQVTITAGGVHVPEASRWTEDLSLPELPTVPDAGVAKGKRSGR